MTVPEDIRVDLCIIGAGSGGLSVAAMASQLGARCVLIERARMGGDCLNAGCIPSKALLAAAKAAANLRRAGRFGLAPLGMTVDYPAVLDHVRDVIAGIAPNDSVERFTGLGVRVIQAAGRFAGPDLVEAGDCRIRARRFVIATGSRPVIPDIPGLASVPYLTNETVFAQQALPRHLIVIGGGPVGIEMAQAHRRLGADVTVVEAGRILGRDDPELADLLRRSLEAEGIVIRDRTRIAGIEADPLGVALRLAGEQGDERLRGSAILVAAGRQPDIAGLGLEAAGIAATADGITVDARLRSTNSRVYVVGDAAGGAQFTHLAGHQAGIVIRNALFRIPSRADGKAVPRVTYTEPELASVGLTEQAARRLGEVRILRWPMAENDRARAERQDSGLVKIVTDRKGRVLGAHILAAHAGDLVLPWILAVDRRLKLGDLATVIAPYPTLSEASKRAAGTFFIPRILTDRTRWLVRLLLRLP